ncbi:MAG TPA: C1 family peptidase [Candidatus Sulfotelmatobacter sp.]|nr:C1 family peptidase [Candidatus Sulfotelmatobacter sp.]
MAVAYNLRPRKRVQLHPGHLRLDEAPIPPMYIQKLKQLGYVSVEQVISVATMAPARSRLSAFLGADLNGVLAPVLKREIAPQLSFKARTAQYKYGSRLEKPVRATLPRLDMAAATHLPPVKTAPAPPASPLGNMPDVNFEADGTMPPVRDQGNRGTCVAHASVAATEHYLITQQGADPKTVDLSEQFLYWDCKGHDGHPNNEGTWLRVAMPLLFTDGCCLEGIWPYNPNPMPGNEGQGLPPNGKAPDGAQSDAATRKIPGAQQLSQNPVSVQEVKDELAQGRCVAVSVVVYEECWTSPEIRNTGNVTMPAPEEISNEGHAICLVGYEDLEGEPELGGGRFILRNSWDSYWGVNCEYGTGYGTLPYAYLTTYGTEAYSIK